MTDGVPRAALQRLGRAEAAARPRTVATDVPQTPRRRGENRPASVFNRGPVYRRFDQAGSNFPLRATILRTISPTSNLSVSSLS